MAAGVSPNFPDRQSPRDQPGFETGRVARLFAVADEIGTGIDLLRHRRSDGGAAFETHRAVLAFTRARSAFIGG
jgi:hypothetical protein